MSHKTKAILKHIGIMLLCLIIGTGLYFLANHFYGSASGGSSHEPDKALQLLGYFLFLACGLFGMGAFIHLRMMISNARVHCRNCGGMTGLNSPIKKQLLFGGR